jgi:hypothetical protein
VVGPTNGKVINENIGCQLPTSVGLNVGNGISPSFPQQQLLNQSMSHYQPFHLSHAGGDVLPNNPLCSTFAGISSQPLLPSITGLSLGNKSYDASTPRNQFRVHDANNSSQFPNLESQHPNINHAQMKWLIMRHTLVQ